MKVRITLICSYLLSITWIISLLFFEESSVIIIITVISGFFIFLLIALFVHFTIIRNYVETTGKKKTLDICLILGIYTIAILFPYIPYVYIVSTVVPLKENIVGIIFIFIIIGLVVYSYYELFKKGFHKETVFNKTIYREYFLIFFLSVWISFPINFFIVLLLSQL